VKRLILIVVALLLAVPATLALAQDRGPKPWEQWQPPAVEMPDPNAFELYELAFDLYDLIDGAPPPAAPRPAEPPVEAGPRLDPGFGRPDELTADELSALCGRYEPVFRLLEEAIAGEAQFPSFEDPAQQMPYFAHIRQGARMFAARSLLRRGEGRPLEAALDAIACIHLGADAGTQGTLIAGLVAIACQAIGQRQLEAAIPELEAPDALAATNALRRAMAERTSFADALRGEETFARLVTQQYLPMFEGVGEAAEQQIAPELAEQMRAMDPDATWEELGAFYGAWIEEAG